MTIRISSNDDKLIKVTTVTETLMMTEIIAALVLLIISTTVAMTIMITETVLVIMR